MLVGMIGVNMFLASARDEKVYLPVPGGRHFLKSRYCPAQTAHNAFVAYQGRSQEFFVNFSGFEAICLEVCPAPHSYIPYAIDETCNLDEMRRLVERAIPPFSTFVGHGYLRDGESGWQGSDSLRYPSYLILSSYVLKKSATVWVEDDSCISQEACNRFRAKWSRTEYT